MFRWELEKKDVEEIRKCAAHPGKAALETRDGPQAGNLFHLLQKITLYHNLTLLVFLNDV